MFIRKTTSYYRGSEQCSKRAPFLLLLQLNKPTIGETCSPSNTYAVVRKVALQQFGAWMMGRANMGGKWHVISGAYGHDGLPMTVDSLPSDAVPLPDDLYQAWNKGGGWNGAGNEAPAMREWALATFKGN